LLSGVIISAILDGSPADESGLQEGDLIISVNGEQLNHVDDLVNRIASFAPGEEVLLTILRGKFDEPIELTVTLGENPDKPDKAYLGIKIGMMIRMDHTEGGHRFDRWIPNFDQPSFPFNFEWHFEVPGSQDA
jgi:PDZ domain-containing secreted protein